VNHQQTTEMDATIVKESQLLDEIFKPVWERVRRAGDLIQHLQEEKNRLSNRLTDLEQSTSHTIQSLELELKTVRQELVVREQELKRVRSENMQLMSNNGQQIFSLEEREIIKDRIRELIAKINSYL
jgi:ABC-type nitrate/sulfonate/bicarbonate transport system ATPase subunit